MTSKEIRTDHKRRKRQAERAAVAQLYEENAEALAYLSQHQQSLDEGSETEDLKNYSKLSNNNQAGCSNNGEKESQIFFHEDDLHTTVQYECEGSQGHAFHSPKSIKEALPMLNESLNVAHDGVSVASEFKVDDCVYDSFNNYVQDRADCEDSLNAGEANCSDLPINESLENSPHSAESPALHSPDRNEIYSITSSDIAPEVWRMINNEMECKTPEAELQTNLGVWCKDYQVKRNAMDKLLQILRNSGHRELPACSKTLLQTPRSTKNIIKNLSGGQFWYRGIKSGIISHLTNEIVQSLQNGVIEIDVFVDGLSPHKSVKRHLWPIAGCITGQNAPFVIALWCGCTKGPTSVDEFFEDYVNEADDLLQNGFIFQGKELKLKIRCYNDDAPARAWIRCVKPHNSYNACERCTVPGEWKFGRITYNPAENGTLRSDESFNNQSHEDHHTGLSPLLRLGTKMITQFPLDIMHMVYLGCTRRLYSLLLQTKTGNFKLPQKDIDKLDKLCVFLSDFSPSDFARKPRPLSEWKLFKTTEFRRLLLYDGFILHKNHKHKELLGCYLLLVCAMRILLDSRLRSEYSSDAHSLLVRFVTQSYKSLGSSFVVYNVHHLLHLVADCNIHGDPERFSCFKYENHLGRIRDLIVAPGRTIQQIICRLIEHSLIHVRASISAAAPLELQLLNPHNKGPTLDLNGNQYAAAKLVHSTVRVATAKPRDSFVVTSSASVVVVENIVKTVSGVYIIGRQFLEKYDFFQYPMPSSLLGIFKVSQLGPLQKYKKEEVTQKIVYYPLNVSENEYCCYIWREGEGLCIPLLHSEEYSCN